MKRRGFLGLMGGAVVAGPGMAKQAAASVGLESMALPSVPLSFDGPDPGYFGSTGQSIDEYDHGEYLKKEIARIVGLSAEERRERISMQNISVIDPDLAANRSFSLAFKVQEQKRRNFERSLAREHGSLTRQLAEYLKRQLS